MASFPLSLKRPDLVEVRGLINGEWIHPGDGETFPVYDPSNGKVIQNCPSFNIDDFRRAIGLAQAGFEDFSRSTTAKERGAILREWNDLVLEHEEDCKHSLKLV
jgi:succinate-semialdehyde dehydrogenase/glutarate-semialdehyde dehydrogenase